MPDARRPARAIPYLLLAGVAVLCYANVFKNTWTHYDDFGITQQRLYVTVWSADNLKTIWTPRGNYVPLRDTFYLLDFVLFGPSITGYQATNLVWHVLGVLALFAFVKRRWGDERIAFLAALLFAVHPLHVEAVAWVAGSKDLMCFTLSVCAALAYHRAMTEPERATRWWVCAGTCLVLALASKLAALALPLAFGALELCDPESNATPWRRRVRRWLPFAVLTGLWFVLAFGPLRRPVFELFGVVAPPAAGHAALTAAGDAQRAAEYWPTMRAMILVTWRYVGLWLWPQKLSAIYTVPLEPSWFRAPVLLGALGLLAGLGVGVGLWRAGSRRAAFWLAWAVAFYLPVSNLLPVTALMNDRYLYIPSAAGAVLLAAGLVAAARRYPRYGPMIVGAALVLVFVLGARTVHRTTAWRSPRALWERAARVDPANVRIQMSLAGLGLLEGQPAEAARALKRLESAAPDDYRRLLLLGQAYISSGRPGAGAATFERGLVLYPEDVDLLVGLGTAVGLQGRYAETLAIASALSERQPGNLQVRLMAGLAHAQLGETAAAIGEFEAAVALAPHEPLVAREAAAALLAGDRPEAARPYAEAWFRLQPSPQAGAMSLRAMRYAGVPQVERETRLRDLRARWPDAAEWREFERP